jgi:hypothetical protein
MINPLIMNGATLSKFQGITPRCPPLFLSGECTSVASSQGALVSHDTIKTKLENQISKK